jgi:hypothetical protein
MGGNLPPPFFPQRDPTLVCVSVVGGVVLDVHDTGGGHRRTVFRRALLTSRRARRKKGNTTRTFGERGARARGKVPHDVRLLRCVFLSTSLFSLLLSGKKTKENAFE